LKTEIFTSGFLLSVWINMKIEETKTTTGPDSTDSRRLAEKTPSQGDSNFTEAQARYWYDEPRLRGQRRRLFELLSGGSWHSNSECSSVGGLSFNGAIYTLRQKGWIVESRYISRGKWEFRLVGRGQARRPRMNHFHRHAVRQYTDAIAKVCDASTLEAIQARVPDWMVLLP
jgi:hypothetical protein